MMPIRFILVLFSIFILISACTDAPDKTALLKKYTNEASKFLSINDMNVHYRDEGAGEVVVLLHGTASSLHTWDKWSNRLRKQYRVIRLDLPGFGLTGAHPLDQYEVNDDVNFLNAFLKRLDINKAHLVGSSLGGRIAWEYSLKHTGQVATLTLINSLGYPQASWPPAIEMAQWPIMDTLIANLSPRFMFDIGLKEIYHDDNIVDGPLVDRYYDLAHYPGNMDAFPKRVKAKLDTQSANIKKITAPTLIQWGEEDLYFPIARAFNFKQDIANASLITYPNVGHLPMEEVGGKSVNDFMAFLSRYAN